MCANFGCVFFSGGVRKTDRNRQSWRVKSGGPLADSHLHVFYIWNADPQYAACAIDFAVWMFDYSNKYSSMEEKRKLADIVLQLPKSNERKWMEVTSITNITVEVVMFVWWEGRGTGTDSLLMQPAWGRSEGLPQTVNPAAQGFRDENPFFVVFGCFAFWSVVWVEHLSKVGRGLWTNFGPFFKVGRAVIFHWLEWSQQLRSAQMLEASSSH